MLLATVARLCSFKPQTGSVTSRFITEALKRSCTQLTPSPGNGRRSNPAGMITRWTTRAGATPSSHRARRPSPGACKTASAKLIIFAGKLPSPSSDTPVHCAAYHQPCFKLFQRSNTIRLLLTNTANTSPGSSTPMEPRICMCHVSTDLSIVIVGMMAVFDGRVHLSRVGLLFTTNITLRFHFLPTALHQPISQAW